MTHNQGRNHLSGQCGKSAPFFTGAEGAPLPNAFLSFCRKRRNVNEKLYINDSIASQASPFHYAGQRQDEAPPWPSEARPLFACNESLYTLEAPFFRMEAPL